MGWTRSARLLSVLGRVHARGMARGRCGQPVLRALSASDPVYLRLDQEAPSLAFEPQDRGRPPPRSRARGQTDTRAWTPERSRSGSGEARLARARRRARGSDAGQGTWTTSASAQARMSSAPGARDRAGNERLDGSPQATGARATHRPSCSLRHRTQRRRPRMARRRQRGASCGWRRARRLKHRIPTQAARPPRRTRTASRRRRNGPSGVRFSGDAVGLVPVGVARTDGRADSPTWSGRRATRSCGSIRRLAADPSGDPGTSSCMCPGRAPSGRDRSGLATDSPYG